MKRFVVFVLLCIMVFLVGCGAGMVDTKEDRALRVRNANDIYARQLVDDWDYFWLYNRCSYMSEWPIRETD